MVVERKCRVGVLLLVGMMWIGFWGEGSWGGVESNAPGTAFVMPYFPVPDRMELCGEPVPLDSADVRERFDREFTSIVYGHGKVYMWLKRMERYFPMLEKQLAAAGLPNDLKYVAVAESDLLLNAFSAAGAAGPWQFISETASRYGISQTPAIDERYDFEAAGLGAFKYLKHLHDEFQNWALAIAAYNCGEQRIHDEIRRQKSRSYYNLKLPNETERYVLRILAIKEVLSNPAKYGYQLPKGAGYQPIVVDKVRISLPGPVPITAAAEAAGISYRELRVLNPSLVSDVLPAGTVTVSVPEGKGKQFEKRIATIQAEAKPSMLIHKVARGETLEGIARKYKAPAKSICEWNGLKNRKVRLGQVLKIYK